MAKSKYPRGVRAAYQREAYDLFLRNGFTPEEAYFEVTSRDNNELRELVDEYADKKVDWKPLLGKQSKDAQDRLHKAFPDLFLENRATRLIALCEGYGDDPLKAVIATDNGEMTVKQLLTKIRKVKGKVDEFENPFHTVYGKDRETVVKAMVLSVNKGFYNLERLSDAVSEMYGAFAGMEVTEKFIRGLTVEFPKRMYSTFTLGLQEIEIK